METSTLNGEWSLKYFEEGKNIPQTPQEMRCCDCTKITACVPGNVELDLVRAGRLPDDLFFGDNILKIREYESYQWWYEREFETPMWSNDSDTELVFDGLDCFATVWINDIKVGDSANAMIGHQFDVGDVLNPAGEINKITVRLASPINAVKNLPIEPACNSSLYSYESLWARKPPHSYGLGLRAVSAGIWRSVYLKEKRSTELTDVFIDTISCSEAEATLLVNIDFRTDLPLRNFTIRVSGNCNDSTFLSEKVMFFVNAGFRIKVVNPKLWWPRGYGEANLYDVKVELLHEGQTVSERKLKIGIRTVKLDRTDISTVEHPGRFQFIVNGTSIFCRGANWIPADAFHSRDIERIPEILEMVAEMGCNMLRCWGGGTYEPHQFYDICDRTGIMIWQDFSMALYAYPQDPHFLEIMREEAEWVIKELRNHSCIALWCGDNECDSCAVTWHREYNDRERIPENNRITREVFPELIRRHDPSRSYLPSSPYIAPEAHRMPGNHRLNAPERHSYPDFNKEAIIQNFQGAVFLSEIGFIGCPGTESIRKFISEDNLMPSAISREWQIHTGGSVPEFCVTSTLISGLIKKTKDFWGEIPKKVEDFVKASQIVQAEAIKYSVELARLQKGNISGILLWVMSDSIPRISWSVVDYYFNKKLAYYYLMRSYAPLAAIIKDPIDNFMEVVVVNDSLSECSGQVVIRDADLDQIVFDCMFSVAANGKDSCGKIVVPKVSQCLYLMEWNLSDGSHGCGHYLYGNPPFDLMQYSQNWLPKIAALDNRFDAQTVGR